MFQYSYYKYWLQAESKHFGLRVLKYFDLEVSGQSGIENYKQITTRTTCYLTDRILYRYWPTKLFISDLAYSTRTTQILNPNLN